MEKSDLECIVCRKVFTGEVSLIQHLNSAKHIKKVRELEIIAQNLTSEVQPQSLEAAYFPQQITCDVCNVKCSGLISYKQHLAGINHLKAEKNMHLEQSQSVLKHEKETTRKDTSEELTYISCDICNIKCSGLISYNQHLAGINHLKAKKRKSMLLELSQNVLKQEKETTEEGTSEELSVIPSEIKCTYCSLSFKNFEVYEEHLKICQRNKKNITIKLPDVGICNTTLNNHNDKNKSSGELTSYASFCEVCSKNFSGPEPYRQHIESANHLKRVKQDVFVQHSFEKNASEKLLNDDNNTVSSAGHPFKCDICNKIFSGIVPFEQHMSSINHIKTVRKIESLSKIRQMSQPYNKQLITNDANSVTYSNENESDKESQLKDIMMCLKQIQMSSETCESENFSSETSSDTVKVYSIENLTLPIFNPDAEVKFSEIADESEYPDLLKNIPNSTDSN